MHTANHVYYHGEQELSGFLAYDNSVAHLRPGVLVVHDWSGRNTFACDKAEMLARLGYVGFAIDMYGQGQLGESVDEKMALMTPFVQNRSLLQERIRAGFDALTAFPLVDRNRIAAIGFCFGGLCVLDLARSGLDFKAAISFHGLLNRPENTPVHPIKPGVLVLHGYDDPMVSPAQVQTFCEEMNESKADWQVHMYGQTKHAFTNPQACDEKMGTVYHKKAETRAFRTMRDFLEEML